METSQHNGSSFNGVVAIGPLVGLPSSNWVGEDIANYLLDNGVQVIKFDNYKSPIEADYIIIVKVMPDMDWLQAHVKQRIRILYAPVDIFYAYSEYWRYKYRLKLFSGLLIHNERLGKLVKNTTTAPQFFIEHYLKYKITTREIDLESRELLWVGHLEYIPSLLSFLKSAKPQFTVRALSDINQLPHYENYLQESFKNLNITYSVEEKSAQSLRISGILIEQWSEEKQQSLMQSCVAAFDTKLDSFAHNLKPPTKAQQFVFNNIPFACSEHSYSYEYFNNIGMPVASLDELDLLASNDYRQRTDDFNISNKWRVEINSVANSYLTACTQAKLPTIRFWAFYNIMNFICDKIALLLKLVNKIKMKL